MMFPIREPIVLDDLTTNSRRPQLLLDGQQRLTSLAAVSALVDEILAIALTNTQREKAQAA